MQLIPKPLRPAKVQNALRRRWFERRLSRIPLSAAPCGLIELGSPYGAWIVPADLIEPSWTCYCVGAGGDVSFDLELIGRGASVRSFDAVEAFVISALEQAHGNPRFSAFQAAIATRDGPIRMQVSHDERSLSVSSARLYESEEFTELPGRTLPSLMAELGDERIDLLKLDIEGAEYEVLPTLDLRALGVKVFAVQLHHTDSVAHARALIAGLRAAGYEPVACRAPLKLTFLAGELIAAPAACKR